MKATLLEVLMDLFHHYLENGKATIPNLNEILDGLDQFSRKLDNSSETPEDSAEAITLGACDKHSIRIYSAQECLKLDTSCRGFLSTLEQARLISAEQREQLIESATESRHKTLSLEELKSMALTVVIENFDNHVELKWLNHVMFQGEQDMIRH